MKRLITGIFAAAMLAASPVWAHGGGHGHGHGHGRGHGHHDERHGGKHFHHGHFDRFDGRRDVVIVREPRFVERRVFVEPQPVFVEPQPVYVQQPSSLNIVVPLR
jgi:hypothetical protein